MNRYIFVPFVIVMAVILQIRCTHNVAGNATQTGNAVIGTLRNANGSPAKNAKVTFITYNYQSVKKRVSIYAIGDSTTTDSNGVYRFKAMVADTYNIFGEDSLGNLSYQDSIIIAGDTANPDTVPPDTLKLPGSISGYIKMEPGDDPRTVTMYVIGATKYTLPEQDASFSLIDMAEGTYRVRILSTLDKYMPLDTTFTVKTGVDLVLTDSIVIPLKIPKITGFTLQYDTLKQIVYLSWNKADTSKVKGYNVYRQHVDSTDVKLNVQALTDTFYVDSTGVQDETYIYSVVGVDLNGDEGSKVRGDSVYFFAPFQLAQSWGSIGSGPGQMNNPVTIITESQGLIFVVDNNNDRIQVFDSAGQYVREFGDYILDQPWDIVVNDTFAYVSCSGNDKIFKFSLNGDSILEWNLPTEAYFPRLAIDSNSNIYTLPNSSYGKIQVYDDTGGFKNEFDISAGNALRITIENNKLFVNYSNDSIVYLYSLTGEFLSSLDLGTGRRPIAIASDSVRLFILDRSTNEKGEVLVYSHDLQYLGKWGGNAVYIQVYDIAVDSFGYVYILDADDRKIYQYFKL